MIVILLEKIIFVTLLSFTAAKVTLGIDTDTGYNIIAFAASHIGLHSFVPTDVKRFFYNKSAVTAWNDPLSI